MDYEEQNERLRSDLNQYLDSDEMVSTAVYMIFGAVMSSARAYEGCQIKIDPKTKRIFVAIQLRWWAKYKKLKKLQKYWLAKTERKAKKFIPNGFKTLYYYGGGDD